MLRDAKAPEPWARADRLIELVEMMQSIAEMSAGLPDPGGHMARLTKVQEAIQVLRANLPGLISFHVAAGAEPDQLFPEDAAYHLRRIVSLTTMQTALVDVVGSITIAKGIKIVCGWHTASSLLFLSYKAVVGKASHSKNGPAVRFIRQGLRASGYGEPELSAIEAALRTHPMTKQ